MTAAVCPLTSARLTRRPTADFREVRGSPPGQPVRFPGSAPRKAAALRTIRARWHSVAAASTSRTRSGALPCFRNPLNTGRAGSTSCPGSGGRSQPATPCEPPGPGGAGAVIRPPVPMAVRSSAIPPHSSQSSSPGSSSALPAATSSRIRRPERATGPVPGTRRSRANPASDGSSITSKRSPVSNSTGGPASAAQPSRVSYHRAMLSPWLIPARAPSATGSRGDGTVRAMPGATPGRRESYGAFPFDCFPLTCKRRARAFRGAKLFARSGGNRCAPHGLSVLAGKTYLVGRGDTRFRRSHVRHRRTGDRGICLACGNIVSHHRVGAVVGCSGPEAMDGCRQLE